MFFERDDDDVSTGLREHIIDDRLDVLRLLGRNDASEVVDVPARLGKLHRGLQQEQGSNSLQRLMPHRQPLLLAIGRVLLSCALCAAAACRGDRARSAQVDTTTGKKGVVVLAPPGSPALRAATVALDSLDRSFAHERASLDSESLALRDANRLDSAYAIRYAAFERRRAAATELRTRRDRARRVRDSVAARGNR